jgi:phosphomannomutase
MFIFMTKEARLLHFKKDKSSIKKLFLGKKKIIFDLDGTLTETKSAIDKEMCELISALLKKYSVSVMSGGSYSQYGKQFLSYLPHSNINLSKLFLYPTCGSCMYKWEENNWIEVYKNKIHQDGITKILQTFTENLNSINFQQPLQLWGDQLENRESQVTWSALGQSAPKDVKKLWDPDFKKRLSIITSLKPKLPEFDVKTGGSTSIDITMKGVDKGYGVKMIKEKLGFSFSEMLFIGDAMFEGGNDYEAFKAGVDSIRIDTPEETKAAIRELLKFSN